MSKHNAHDKMILVRHQPGRKRKQAIQLVLLLLVCASTAYYIGIFDVRTRHQSAVSSLDALSEEHRKALAENKELRQKLANIEQSEAINLHAKQEIQVTLGELREHIAALQKDVRFYQNIMAPSKNNKGLQIQTTEISALEQNQRYAYKIVLAQVADNRRYLNGVAAVNLIGKQDGEDLVLPLRDVSSVEELGLKFKFRYFQEFTGEISLPIGFVPEQLQVVAQSKGKKASRVEKNTQWSELVPESLATVDDTADKQIDQVPEPVEAQAESAASLPEEH